jgi:Ribbon-helix-helix protein, copG family
MLRGYERTLPGNAGARSLTETDGRDSGGRQLMSNWLGIARSRASASHALSCDIREAGMTDMLIRDVPDNVIAALDAHAGRLGLSRSEYVRRRLAQDAARPGSLVSVQDLARFSEVFGDLADPDVMSQAWR